MLAIRNAGSGSDQCSVNIMPCQIHHNGPTTVKKQHWNTKREEDGSRTAYFRGRRLKGKPLKLPEGYEGIVVKATDRTAPSSNHQEKRASIARSLDDGASQDEDDDAEPVRILDSVSSIDEIIVWGHDQQLPADDAFVKGVEEWLAFSKAIHSTSTSSQS